MRSFFTVQRAQMLLRPTTLNYMLMRQPQTSFMMQSGALAKRDFSIKMRKVREKQAKVKKFKLKTKKSFQKRFRIVSHP